MVSVKVPATSANMGSGFDTLGLGLCLYSIIDMEETESGLTIVNNNSNCYAPTDERNLIYRAAKCVFEETGYNARGLYINQDSRIPMTRGLGSSSACTVGGMLAANVISGRHLSYGDILNLASRMEGHPDNAAPAIYGGLCTSVTEGGRVYTKSVKINPRIKAAVFIPAYYVSTRKSRTSVPDRYSRADTVSGISNAVMMFAAMTSGDLDLLRPACSDRIHQPYRKHDIEGFDLITEIAYDLGAKGVYLSGSGPSVVAIIDETCMNFRENAEIRLRDVGLKMYCRVLSIDNVGSVVTLKS